MGHIIKSQVRINIARNFYRPRFFFRFLIKQVVANSHYLIHPHSLAIFEDQIFWTDRQLNRVMQARKFRGTNETIITHLVAQPISVHIHHPALQPMGPNPCEKAKCEQLCLLAPMASSPVGFSCRCRPGYRLGDDGSCIEKDEPFLMVIKENQIADISLTEKDKANTGHFTPVVDVKVGVSVDYDAKNNDIFWVEVEAEGQFNGTLYRTPLGGGDKVDFFRESAADGEGDEDSGSGLVGSPYCVAFDWVGRNMYVGNVEAAEIILVRVDGKFRYQMLVLDNNGGVGQPVSMALHPASGRLFWADRGGKGGNAKVGKVNMDGTEQEDIVSTDLANPEYVAIDLQKEILYVSSSGSGSGGGSSPPKIESCNLDGTNRLTIVSSEKNHPVARPTAIAVMDRRLYFVDPLYEKVSRVDASDGSNEEVLLDNEANLRSLNIFRKRQRKCRISS